MKLCFLPAAILFLFPFAKSQAQPGNTTQTLIRYLSGTDKDNTVTWDFYCSAGRNSGRWTKIAVPSNWELQGFGTYNYGQQPPAEQSDEYGMYRHQFTVDPSMHNKRIYIVFEGSMTDTEVKINGKQAGPVHQGAFYEFRYDITRLLKKRGQNLLEVKVNKKSANESVNRAERYADYWIFGGIFRPVYLMAVPEQFIEHVAIDAKADGSFSANVYHAGKTATTLQLQVKTINGEPVGAPVNIPIQGDSGRNRITASFDNIKTWTAEAPHRYHAEFTLLQGTTALHSITTYFGFRTIELRPHDGIYVNGARIRLKGVNRHSFWPASGRTTSKALSISDVLLIKSMNMNAVRMSHYPPDKHFLDACDSLGLYVLDELGGWQKAYDTVAGEKLVKEMVIRDVNHPSIIIWDNGNEGGNNFALDDDFALYDPQKRPVIHPWAVFGHTDTQHYKPFDCCTGTLFHGQEVFFPTEFLHGLYDGGSGAGLEDHWNQMLKNRLSAGGFLWALVDEAVVRTDKNGILDAYKNYGPDGIVGPYREKEGSYHAIRQIWSPVYIHEDEVIRSREVTINVENRYYHTNLNACTFAWKLSRFNIKGHDMYMQPLDSGRINAPDVAPGLTGQLHWTFSDNFNQATVAYITATDKDGREIYTWSFLLEQAADIANRVLSAGNNKATATETVQTIQLSANGVQVEIDKQSGKLVAVSNQGKPLSFSNGPFLENEPYKIKGVKHYAEGNDYVVDVLTEGGLKHLQYRMLSTGWLQLNYGYLPGASFDFAGVSFDYPEEKVKGISWMGRGPFRVWKNRIRGVEYNLWQKDYNNTAAGSEWNYPEFKGYHRDFLCAVLNTTELPVVMLSGSPDIYLRLFTPARQEDARNAWAPFPSGSISFLHGISAIGTKFLKAGQLGPQGQQNMFKYNGHNPKLLTATLYFYFGELANGVQ